MDLDGTRDKLAIWPNELIVPRFVHGLCARARPAVHLIFKGEHMLRALDAWRDPSANHLPLHGAERPQRLATVHCHQNIEQGGSCSHSDKNALGALSRSMAWVLTHQPRWRR